MVSPCFGSPIGTGEMGGVNHAIVAHSARIRSAADLLETGLGEDLRASRRSSRSETGEAQARRRRLRASLITPRRLAELGLSTPPDLALVLVLVMTGAAERCVRGVVA